MTYKAETKNSIVFGEHTIIHGYSLFRTEKHCHHWHNVVKGFAVELFEDKCWRSVHSNDANKIIDDERYRSIFREKSNHQIKSYFQIKFPEMFLPDTSLKRVILDTFKVHSAASMNSADECKYHLILRNRFITVSRCGEPMRSDIQRQIVIRVFRGKNERNFIDYPVRTVRSYSKIDWLRAFGDAHKYSSTYFSNASAISENMSKKDKMDIVFEGGVGAIAIHEACGHLVEADLSTSGFPFSKKRNDKVAGDIVSLIDDPTIPGALGSYSIDDEGKTARTTTVIEKGRLKRFLCSMRYSDVDDEDSSANGRRYGYRDRAYPRMSNLVLLPGKTNRAEIIRSVSKGILVKTLGVGGESYPGFGSFALSVRDGRYITDGKVDEPTGRFIVQGNSSDFLKGITLVGRKQAYKPLATLCEKHQQRLYTDGIAPPFLVRNASVFWGVHD